MRGVTPATGDRGLGAVCRDDDDDDVVSDEIDDEDEGGLKVPRGDGVDSNRPLVGVESPQEEFCCTISAISDIRVTYNTKINIISFVL